jgi:hypothetical protein
VDLTGLTGTNFTFAEPWGHKTTELNFRRLGFPGIVVDYGDMTTANYIPLVLNYGFPNESGVEGSVHKIDSPRIEIMWDNPRDRGDPRLYYRAEISQHPAFHSPLVFDSFYNQDGFFVSDDGVNFSQMGTFGAPAGRGKTHFVCPVDLPPGRWFVRLVVGNKRG